jgi:hypothetical protein
LRMAGMVAATSVTNPRYLFIPELLFRSWGNTKGEKSIRLVKHFLVVPRGGCSLKARLRSSSSLG